MKDLDLRNAFSDGFAEGFARGREDATKWIPVKERLPEEDTDVLCTIHFEGKHLAPLAREWFVDICHCRDGEWYTYLDDDATKDAWFDVVAWMPLPNCYEGEQK